MAEGLQWTCPVDGFTVITPKGEDDLMEHIALHGKKFHADMPMTPDQVRSTTKKVEMPEMKQMM